MKLILLSFYAAFAVACTATPASVKIGDIEATGSKNLGTDEAIYARKGDAEVAIISNNSRSFFQGAKTARFGLGAWALTDIVGTVTGGIESVQADKTAAGVSETVAKEGTKRASIQATTDQAKIAADAAVLGGVQ